MERNARSVKASVRTLLLVSICTIATLLPLVARAEVIDSFSTWVEIYPDASVRITESIAYDFEGAERHGIYRDIPLSYTTSDGSQGMMHIRSVAVSDASNKAYPYETSQENGVFRIKIGDPDALITGEKVYNIFYSVEGALAPYNEFDELYWNTTGDAWEVPIRISRARVTLPATVDESKLHVACYSGVRGSAQTCEHVTNLSEDDRTTIAFLGTTLGPREGLTVAIGFPKGLVTYPTFWEVLWRAYGLTIVASVLLLAAIAFAVWYVRRVLAQGRGTIIPEYEPPAPLPPAQVDVLVNGWVSKSAWPATVVDLAVNGYVRIKEDEPESLWRLGWFWMLILGGVVVVILTAVGAYTLAVTGKVEWAFLLLPVFFILTMMFLYLATKKSWNFSRTEYLIEAVPTADRTQLEDYERQFLDILLPSGTGMFSTKEMKRSQMKQRELYAQMQKLEDALRSETATDTKAYTLDPQRVHKRIIIFALIFGIVLSAVFTALGGLFEADRDLAIASGLTLLAAFIAAWPVFFWPRLNREGSIAREQWLGFKLYLHTAERYRLQNLTPDRFEKFLPYAMVFGIEKKWAKAFEDMNVLPPSWYSGSAAHGAVFSTTAFTGSFSSSFSSSFAATGASGSGSSGGGSAGGGRGGGGGGSW